MRVYERLMEYPYEKISDFLIGEYDTTHQDFIDFLKYSRANGKYEVTFEEILKLVEYIYDYIGRDENGVLIEVPNVERKLIESKERVKRYEYIVSDDDWYMTIGHDKVINDFLTYLGI